MTAHAFKCWAGSWKKSKRKYGAIRALFGRSVDGTSLDVWLPPATELPPRARRGNPSRHWSLASGHVASRRTRVHYPGAHGGRGW